MRVCEWEREQINGNENGCRPALSVSPRAKSLRHFGNSLSLRPLRLRSPVPWASSNMRSTGTLILLAAQVRGLSTIALAMSPSVRLEQSAETKRKGYTAHTQNSPLPVETRWFVISHMAERSRQVDADSRARLNAPTWLDQSKKVKTEELVKIKESSQLLSKNLKCDFLSHRCTSVTCTQKCFIKELLLCVHLRFKPKLTKV